MLNVCITGVRRLAMTYTIPLFPSSTQNPSTSSKHHSIDENQLDEKKKIMTKKFKGILLYFHFV
jgi:hypothetical protein